MPAGAWGASRSRVEYVVARWRQLSSYSRLWRGKLGAKGIQKRVIIGLYRWPLNAGDGVRGIRFKGKGGFVLVIAMVTTVHIGCFDHGSPHAVFDVIHLEVRHDST
jgi:hypothetical protein